ncbi:MAG: hypothetical protein IT328_24250 [Caldilineaceae bacterium]|nr:hypothetical protein [Caldilineaceae bacterium]
MVRLLRWGTLIVLLLVIIGVAANYPILRARLFAPMLATPPGMLAVANSDALSTILPTSTVRPTARPTLPATRSSVPAPVQIIAPTAPASSTQVSSTAMPSPQSLESPTPPVIATTSLLQAIGIAGEITPVVLAPSTDGITKPDLPAPPISPTVATPAVVTPIVVTPVVVTALRITPTASTIVEVTPIVVLTVEVATPLATPTSIGPTANSDSPLYSGPDATHAIVGEVKVGDPLTIIGRHTEGTWYLLANGQWLPGAAVDNAPLALPLVFPTVTPIPSATPTVTPTPPPTATPETSPSPTPTPTSLDAPVCDCSADTYDCLGNIFASRDEAQRCFEYCFRQKGIDIHLLDPNLNGLACENLP